MVDADGGSSAESETDEESGRSAEAKRCEESGCESTAAVRLHVPWDANRATCTACARGLVQREGVVAEPLDGAEAEWP